MTYEEAKQAYALLEQYRFYKGKPTMKEATPFYNIISAIDKQTEKVPGTDSTHRYCPTCGQYFGKQHPHCWNCGQKLDWGDKQ